MSGTTTLSSAVRTNLLSLQSTADALAKTQEKLATGLKVNSALDDPTAFFTASSLNSRSNDLSRLQDFVGNSVQTLKAADEGIQAITKLVESAEATARQALNSAGSTAKSTGDVDITAATNYDFSSSATATGTVDLDGSGAFDFTATVTASVDLDTANVAGGDDGKQFTISDGTNTTADITINTGDDATAVQGKIAAALTAAGITSITATEGTGGDAGKIVLTSAEDDIIVAEGTVTGGAAAIGLTAGTTTASNSFGIENGDTFTVQVGAAAAQTITFGTDGGSGEVNSLAELEAALDGLTDVSASVDGTTGVLSITASGGDLTLAEGTNTPLADLGITAGATTATSSSTSGLTYGDSFSVQVGSADAVSITFGSSTGQVDTQEELLSALNAIDNVSATVTDDGFLSIEATNGEDLTIAEGTNTPADTLGLTAATTEATANADRAAFAAQFDELRTQINQLAADASYNGNNLLTGDSLTVTFNEDSTSSLTIEGVNFNSAGLGIDSATDTFQKDSDINAALADLTSATSSLRSQASKFGSNLSVVETRQDFTKNLINVLETGAANLTLADTNEEGANLLALQTRQQLSSTSLSLASQADQNVLRLF